MANQASLTVADWHRLNRLLEQGLGFEGAERSAWLESLDADDQHLRAVLIDLLAQSDATDFSIGATHPPTTVARMAASALAAMRHEQPGDRIGPWQLERLIAEGGMGAVWVAERADGVMKRTAALKLPRAEWVDRGLTERIARERAILARLQHPHIAVLYDAGVTAEGRPYLALEYVDGKAIDAYCRDQALDSLLRLFVQVVRAVAYAHSRLVVHRDLKPSNVLVTPDGTPKLLDFGISKLLEGDGAAPEATALTLLSGRPMTLRYAAPEQVLGLPITVAADVYALGVMLFELVTRQHLYRATEPRALEAEVLRGDVRKPSEVTEEKARAKTLRGDLDAIILSALKREPGERYQSAAAFADDIDNYLAGLPVRAQPDSRTYRLRKFIQRNTLPVAATSAIVIALGIGLGVALWQARVARDEAARATMIKDFVLSIIQQADPVASRQTREADVALLTTAESRIERELESEPELALQMRRAIGAAYRNRGEFQRASQVLRKGIEHARTTLPPNNLELLGAMVQIADRWIVDNRRQVTADLESAITHLRALGPTAQALLADALLFHHKLTGWMAPWREAVESGRAAYRAARAIGDEGRMLDAAADQVQWYVITGIDPKEALSMIAEAVEYAKRRGRIEPADPRWIIALAWHGAALCATGQKAEGLKLAEEAVGAARKFHGADSNVLEETQGALGVIFGGCMRDAKRALEPMREAYAISVKREAPESENRAFRQTMLTGTLFELSMHDEVERLLRETPPVPFSSAALQTAPAVFRLTWEADTRLRLGDTEKAEEIAEEAVRLMEGEKLFVVAERQYGVLAYALHQNGKLERAERFALAALEHEDVDLPATPGGRAAKLLLLSWIRIDLGKHQGALEAADQALKLLSEQAALSPYAQARVDFRRGRALLGLGRHREAVEALASSNAYWVEWRKSNPTSVPAATGAYWYGQALIAAGEAARGRALIAESKPTLATSRYARDRALVTDGGTQFSASAKRTEADGRAPSRGARCGR